MPKFKIVIGLKEAQEIEIKEFENEDLAMEYAICSSVQNYEILIGMDSLKRIENIMNENQFELGPATDVYSDELDKLLVYDIKEV
jgi:hypothetical protein